MRKIPITKATITPRTIEYEYGGYYSDYYDWRDENDNPGYVFENWLEDYTGNYDLYEWYMSDTEYEMDAYIDLTFILKNKVDVNEKKGKDTNIFKWDVDDFYDFRDRFEEEFFN